MYVGSQSIAYFNSVAVDNVRSLDSGGFIYSGEGSQIHMKDAIVHSNASIGGGAIFVGTEGVLSITNTSLSCSANLGGCIYAGESSNTTVVDLVSDLSNATMGGFIYLEPNSQAHVRDSRVTGYARNDGGVSFASDNANF